jgi:CelD/BcsL family acetyltransferase involved in cellulose biosynthesis
MIQIETHDRVTPLAREWDELAERLGASPFLRAGWIAAWWDAFASGSLAVVGARRHGELVGVVPVCRRRGELRSASNDHSPEFGFLAADREIARELARAIYVGRETAICLDFIDPHDIGLEACRYTGEQAGYRTVERPRWRSPFLMIEGDWSEYTSRLARKPRYETERRFRRLGEAGTVALEIAEGSEQLDDLLEQGFRVEAAGWKGEQGTAVAARPETRSFYTGVARWAAERGWLRLAFLRLDGRALAFVFGLEADGVFYCLKEGFDPAFRRFGPGGILRYQLLARAFSAGLRRYEFLGDAEPWKLEWTATCRERSTFRAFAPSLAGSLKWTVHAHGYRLAKRVPLARNARRLLRR